MFAKLIQEFSAGCDLLVDGLHKLRRNNPGRSSVAQVSGTPIVCLLDEGDQIAFELCNVVGGCCGKLLKLRFETRAKVLVQCLP